MVRKGKQAGMSGGGEIVAVSAADIDAVALVSICKWLDKRR